MASAAFAAMLLAEGWSDTVDVDAVCEELKTACDPQQRKCFMRFTQLYDELQEAQERVDKIKTKLVAELRAFLLTTYGAKKKEKKKRARPMIPEELLRRSDRLSSPSKKSRD